jgi:hypothetical protein
MLVNSREVAQLAASQEGSFVHPQAISIQLDYHQEICMNIPVVIELYSNMER